MGFGGGVGLGLRVGSAHLGAHPLDGDLVRVRVKVRVRVRVRVRGGAEVRVRVRVGARVPSARR